MYTPAGKFSISKEPIPGITEKVIKIRRELDDNRRDAMLKEIQRDLALDMTALVAPGYSLGFTPHGPWLKNYGVFTHGDLTQTWSSSRLYTEYWYDKSAQL
jgi:ABC-type transport system substrate-binding protein